MTAWRLPVFAVRVVRRWLKPGTAMICCVVADVGVSKANESWFVPVHSIVTQHFRATLFVR